MTPMLNASPHNFTSPHRNQKHPVHQRHHPCSPSRPLASRTEGKETVACALFMDGNDEQVKRSNIPSKGNAGTAQHLGVGAHQQHDAPRPPLHFHEWKQTKQHKPQGALPAAFASAGSILLPADEVHAFEGLPQLAVAEGLPQVVTEVDLSMAPAANAVMPLADVSDSSLQLQSSDWFQSVPYLGSSSNEPDSAQAAASRSGIEANTAAGGDWRPMLEPASGPSSRPLPDVSTSQTTIPEAAVGHPFEATLERLTGALAIGDDSSGARDYSQGPALPYENLHSSGAIEASAAVAGHANDGIRRSVLGPLEHAIGNAIGGAWHRSVDPLVAAIEQQLPEIDDLPGAERLQDVLAGIKQLGDNLSSSMNTSWSTHPTLSKILAYLAASLGILLLIRTKPSSQSQQRQSSKSSPPAMITPRSKGSGELGKDSQVAGGGESKGLWGRGKALGSAVAAFAGDWQQAGQQKAGSNQQKQILAKLQPQGQLPSEAKSRSAEGLGRKAEEGGVSASSPQGAQEDMQNPEQLRQRIKRLLHQVSESLGPLAAIMPGGAEPIRHELDTLLQQLESIVVDSKGRPLHTNSSDSRRSSINSVNTDINSPAEIKWEGAGLGVAQWDSWERKTGTREWDSRTPVGGKPPAPDSRMLGAWQLEYASLQPVESEEEGALFPPPTSTLPLLMQLVGSIPSFEMDPVVQYIWQDPFYAGSALGMVTSCTFRLGPLGSLRLSAQGGWREGRRISGQQGAPSQAWFDTFSVQPLSLLGMTPTEGVLPEVVVPLPPSFQEPTDWRTTYLDAECRISRGASGAYLFEKLPPVESTLQQAQPFAF